MITKIALSILAFLSISLILLYYFDLYPSFFSGAEHQLGGILRGP